jgi:type IV pilus assembly protein PilQ
VRLTGLLLATALLAASAPASTFKVHSPQPQKFTGEKISIMLRDADIKDVLHAFGKLTGLSIAIDPEVHASVSIDLVDVPWDQALDLILRQHKLISKFENGVLRVMPR